jgi:pimeloyl-ACP methyl ester carboxylesterase
VSEDAEPASAPLVALVHGSMDRATSFARVRHRLGRFRTIAYDRRGYRRSIHSRPLASSLDEHVDDLLWILDGRATVVAGHSYGGDVAIGAALRRPDVVRAVVAYEAPMPWAEWWPRRTAGGSAASARTPEDAAEAFLRRTIGDDRWERLPERTKDARRSEGHALAAEMASLRESAPFDVAELAVPLVVGRGTESVPHHRESAERLARAVAGGELHEIEGAGHDAHLTHPDGFAWLVERAAARADTPLAPPADAGK